MERNINIIIDNMLSVPQVQFESIVSERELCNYILSCVLSSKFRKTKADQITITSLEKKIIGAVTEKRPLEFTIPFGAYKGWKLPTHPETDWAEVFNIRHIIDYLLPVAQMYKWGVIVYYTFQDNIMHEISNIPKENLLAYKKAFLRLLDYYNSQLNGIKFEMFSISDLYKNDEEYFDDYKKGFEYNLTHWDEKYSEEERNKKVNSAKNNLARKGIVDYSYLSDEEWERKCIISAMQTDAVDCLFWRREFNKKSKRIQLVFVRGPENSIHIGSCLTSTAHFWAGTGVLEYNKKLLPRIFPQNKYMSLVREDKFVRYNLENVLCDISDNYMYVELLKK